MSDSIESLQEWFIAKAKASLKKTREHLWDFSDPALLYAPGIEAQYADFQKFEHSYSKLVTQPEQAYLDAIAGSVIERLPETFDYIDLGPGTAGKEKLFFAAAARLHKQVTYRPVDINQAFLDVATQHASESGMEAMPAHVSFEELGSMLPASRYRFVSLGLTYINYVPEDALQMLRGIVGEEQGSVFINAHIRERVDMRELVTAYQQSAALVTGNQLRLVGINPDTDVSVLDVTDGVEIWCTLQRVSPEAESFGFQEGDRILLFRSTRYSLNELERVLRASSNFSSVTLFDTGAPFVSALLTTYS